ncbi:glycoside hydrolase family 43 protein [Promicromonospora sp. NPDC060204]|uniref:glycoside hydrolase family 43 protein n=1 Tax=Promicromonospora sp. NPDC060204 TaxID=3347071 RepID=UPI003666F790
MTTNPVYGSNFPDPAVLEVDGTYWAYATRNRVETLPVLRSTDLVHWELVGDGMPEQASWVAPGRDWAPEVAVVGERYVAYYTAHDRATDVQAVGVAVADEPYGPFRDDADRPLLCQDTEGGSIDASPFTDADGSRWLLWKNDGNHVGVDTWIYVQRLSDDGLRLQGEPSRILKQDQEWEGTLVEGPYVWPHGGRYYLFYSGNAFDSDRYGVGYAVADRATGPYVKPGRPDHGVERGGGRSGPRHGRRARRAHLVRAPRLAARRGQRARAGPPDVAHGAGLRPGAGRRPGRAEVPRPAHGAGPGLTGRRLVRSPRTSRPVSPAPRPAAPP